MRTYDLSDANNTMFVHSIGRLIIVQAVSVLGNATIGRLPSELTPAFEAFGVIHYRDNRSLSAEIQVRLDGSIKTAYCTETQYYWAGQVVCIRQAG